MDDSSAGSVRSTSGRVGFKKPSKLVRVDYHSQDGSPVTIKDGSVDETPGTAINGPWHAVV